MNNHQHTPMDQDQAEALPAIPPQLPIHVYPPNAILNPKEVLHSKEPQLFPYLCHLDVHPDSGRFLVTSNDLTGRIWSGTAFVCANRAAVLDLNADRTFVSTSGISAAKFLNGERIVVAENGPTLGIIEARDEAECVLHMADSFALDERMLHVCPFDERTFVGCSERVVSSWAVCEGVLKVLQEFPCTDDRRMTSVCSDKTGVARFVSTDSTGSVLLWDLRVGQKPAKLVFRNDFSQATCCDTNAADSNVLAVGTDHGDVYLLDVRKPNEFLAKRVLVQDARVQKVRFGDGGDSLAVCGYGRNVVVYKCRNYELKDATVCEMEREHEGFVSDLVWKKDELYSCGFDGKVLVRKVQE